jgi:hypothetical protein
LDGVDIVYVTHRAEPRFDWFADALAVQLADDDDIVVTVVDGQYGPERAARFADAVAGRFPLRHVPPKPTPFNGTHRLTRRQYHAVSSVRNTGIVYAERPYVAFVDDCAVLMPGWLEEVRAAAREGYVAVGAYEKRWDMVVENGLLVSSRSEGTGMDSRWEQGADDRPVPISGAQLFGASFAAPRSLLVAIGGFDELCDSIGGEDWQLGVRLEWAGGLLCYSRRMLTIESEDLHRHAPPMWRIDPVAEPDVYRARLARFGVDERAFPDGPFDCSHMLLDVLYGLRQTRAIGNHYELAELSPDGLADTVEKFPRTHWFDGRALGDL